jgi:hypothetical protein
MNGGDSLYSLGLMQHDLAKIKEISLLFRWNIKNK